MMIFRLLSLGRLFGSMSLISLLSISLHAATDTEAKVILDSYNAAYTQWQSEMSLARDPRTVDIIMKKRPDAGQYASKLKSLIRSDLANEWSIKYGAWLLENDTKLRPESQHALLNAVEKHHIKSPLVGRFCMSLVNLRQGDESPKAGKLPLASRGMTILETVKKNNPNTKVQGQAALALSMMLSGLGDDSGVMRERITQIKEAIIKSADVKVGNVTVGDIAKDELYKISNLTKGRVAPNITGLDSSSRAFNLKEYRGKVVMLVFWSSWDTDANRALKILRNSVNDKQGKPFAVLGVNRDTLPNLRALEADQIVTWRNFSDHNQKLSKVYRVSNWPYCLVLDQNGAIAYRGTPGSFADAVANNLLLAKDAKLTP